MCNTQINILSHKRGRVEELIAWLEEELRLREWQPSDLARRAGLGNSTVQRIMAGTRRAGKDVCQKIATALGEPPEKVYRLAGILPVIPTEAAIEEEMIGEFRTLPHQQQQFILDAMRGLQKKPPRDIGGIGGTIALPGQSHPDKEILREIWDSLDALERHAVYDYALWRLEEQERRRNSDDERKKSKAVREEEINRAIEHLDLLITIDETDPLHVQRVIDRLQRRLIPEQESSATRKNQADQF